MRKPLSATPSVEALQEENAALRKKNEELRKDNSRLAARNQRLEENPNADLITQRNLLKARKKQLEQDLDLYRECLWILLQSANALAQAVQDENTRYGKLFNTLWLPLQLLLGNARAGLDYSEQRSDLLRALRQCLSSAPAPPQETSDPIPPPTPQWTQKNADADVRQVVRKIDAARLPPLDFRALLAHFLLALTDGQEPERLTAALRICGIIPLYYAEAPAALKETFILRANSAAYPGLFWRTNPEGELTVLVCGAHIYTENADASC